MKTILIIEDIEFNIDLLIQILEDDYDLIIARDGEQGVALAEEKKPNLILMDISLPIIDGYEASRRIHNNFPSIPIIGLSAHAMSSDSDQAIAAGCVDYLTKPVDEEILVKKITEYIG